MRGICEDIVKELSGKIIELAGKNEPKPVRRAKEFEI